MRRVKKSPYNRLRKNKKAASPAISMVIITAITVVLVLVTGNYAYQVLERQQGASEFETVKKSVLVFDDAVRNVAWDLGGSRSARFTVNYGQLRLVPAGMLVVNASVGDNCISENVSTFFIRYSISNRYVNLGHGYSAYLFGNASHIVTGSVDSFGRTLIEQKSGWVDITLDYRVRVMRTLAVKVGNDTVNYVNILMMKITVLGSSTYIGDFNLAARNAGITTKSYGPYNTNGTCNVLVNIGGSSSSATMDLEPGKVVFNFVIAEVQVSA